MMILPILFIGPAKGKDRGVFSSKEIQGNTTIEISPVIVMSREDRVFLDKTLLHDYIFEWENEKDHPIATGCCMALGYVPIYNHSYEANCDYEMDYENRLISIKTLRDIEAGEELMINYNGTWNDKKPVWFDKG